MYSASAEFLNLIKQKERTFIYSGSIVTVDETTYDFYGNDIRSGKVIHSICDNDKLEIGTVYASEFDCELMLDVSRYELYNGAISLNIKLEGADDVIPMGTYIISEINQTLDKLNIKAYDDMIKFSGVKFIPTSNTSLKYPHEWIAAACTACGVTMGNTAVEIKAMPNGKRQMGYADIASDVETWRDVLGYIAAALGGYAYIGRDRKLYFGTFKGTEDDTIPANFRYSSNLSDYQTTFNGIYGVYKKDGVQEYAENENADGLILDIGANPFLQFTKTTNRINALREIINAWNGLSYVPFEANIPMNPLYDAGDVLKFTGNQATDDVGVITDITYTIGGQMFVKCSGANPRLAEAQDRFTKTIEGYSSEYSNTKIVGAKGFWKLSTTNTDAITVGGTEIQLTEIEWHQSTIFQDIEMLLTIDAVLSATAKVEIRLIVDDEEDFEMHVTEDKSLIGERVFHCTNPQKIEGVGSHVAKVYMKVTDSPLLVGDLV